MKRLNYFIAVAFNALFFLNACQKTITLPPSEIIRTDSVHQALTFEQALGDYNFVKLGALDKGFLQSIDQLIVHKEHFYVIDKGQHKIVVYQANGEFVRQLQAHGDGPMEYTQLGPVQIDTKNDLLYISDQHKGQFLVYDLHFEYIKSIKTPGINFTDFHLIPEENQILLTFRYNPFTLNDIVHKYSLALFQLEPFALVEGFLPYKDNMLGKAMGNHMLFGQDELYFFRPFDPTFYAFDPATEPKVYPRFNLTFKEGFIRPNVVENASSINEIMKEIKEITPEVMYIQHMLANDQYLLFEYQTGTPMKGFHIAHNLQTKLTTRIEEGEKDMRLIQYPIATYQDYLISVVDANTLEFLSKETDYNTTNPRIPLPAYDLEEDAHFLLLHKLKL